MKRLSLSVVLACVAIVAMVALFAQPIAGQIEGVTNLNGLHLSQTSFGTATPQVMVQNGGSGVSLEVRNSSATPVFSVGSAGAVTQNGDTTIGAGLVLSQQSETVTATFIITPTSSYVVITSNAAYTSNTTTPISAGTAGQIIVVRNGNASDALTIDGTGGSVECKANVVLGASDTITLIYNGTDWNCISVYDNS